jgi:hypothetical protein
MKIEFIKETKVNGESFYFTRVNNRFIDGSLSFDIDKSKIIFDNIVKNKGKIDFTEVLESVEIEVAE